MVQTFEGYESLLRHSIMEIFLLHYSKNYNPQINCKEINTK